MEQIKKSELLEKAMICVVKNKDVPISIKVEILRVLMREESLALYVEKEREKESEVKANV